jgi:hypothetical protein
MPKRSSQRATNFSISAVGIQQACVGSYREAVFVGGDGKVYIRQAQVRDTEAFARIWERNIKA